MSLDSYRIPKLTCPRHRRYNPVTEGQSGIKGACPICLEILRVWNLYGSVLDAAHDATEKIQAARNRDAA